MIVCAGAVAQPGGACADVLKYMEQQMLEEIQRQEEQNRRRQAQFANWQDMVLRPGVRIKNFKCHISTVSGTLVNNTDEAFPNAKISMTFKDKDGDPFPPDGEVYNEKWEFVPATVNLPVWRFNLRPNSPRNLRATLRADRDCADIGQASVSSNLRMK